MVKATKTKATAKKVAAAKKAAVKKAAAKKAPAKKAAKKAPAKKAAKKAVSKAAAAAKELADKVKRFAQRLGASKPAKQPAVSKPAKPDAAGKNGARSARARGVSVDDYASTLAAPVRDWFAIVRAVIRETAPVLVESIKWGQPVYESNGPAIYVRGSKAHLTVGFWRGDELEASGFGGLDGEGTKMRHVKFHAAEEIDRERLAAIVTAAVTLNGERGDPTRG